MQQPGGEPVDLGLDPLQMDITVIAQLGGGEAAQGRRQLTQRGAADMARRLAQCAESLGERSDIGGGGGAQGNLGGEHAVGG